MLNLLTRKTRRNALKGLILELFRYNSKDDCWDPIGSIDRLGMVRVVEVIARGKLDPEAVRRVRQAGKFFKVG